MDVCRASLTGLILTGGASTRMGRPKATLTLAGRPMWQHVAKVLAQFTDNILLVGSVGDFAPPPPYRLLPDKLPGWGPIGGLLTGLESSGTSHHIVVGVDYPFVRPKLLQLCLEKAQNVHAVCGRSELFIEPLVGYYHSACSSIIRLMIGEDENRMHKLIDRIPAVILSNEEFEHVDPDRLSQFNVNTSDDLKRAETMLEQGFSNQEHRQ